MTDLNQISIEARFISYTFCSQNYIDKKNNNNKWKNMFSFENISLFKFQYYIIISRTQKAYITLHESSRCRVLHAIHLLHFSLRNARAETEVTRV